MERSKEEIDEHRGPNGEEPFGWVDDEGNVCCGLCDWSVRVGSNVERAEHEIRRHVKDKHGRNVLYWRDESTGPRVEIPN